jgi:hypothetical protein
MKSKPLASGTAAVPLLLPLFGSAVPACLGSSNTPKLKTFCPPNKGIRQSLG